jgi:UDP-N-acetylglucosamine acyltransferase
MRQDVPPYAMVQGDPAKIIGINSIGLSRRGWSKEKLCQLREAYRCFRNKLEPVQSNELFDELQAFKAKSYRGIIKLKKKGQA